MEDQGSKNDGIFCCEKSQLGREKVTVPNEISGTPHEGLVQEGKLGEERKRKLTAFEVQPS